MTAVIIRSLGQQDYQTCWQTMKEFTNHRDEQTLDELWIVEHPPIFTQGQNGKPEHVLNAGDIPVLPVDRGGQVTYHGPGQLMLYTLIDIKRLKLNVRQLVNALENAVINLLASYHIDAVAKCDAPGVYVSQKKICSVGLRIRRGCAYHGLALNVDMDLTPFERINPCGYPALKMTQLKDLIGAPSVLEIGTQLVEYLITILGYTSRLDKME